MPEARTKQRMTLTPRTNTRPRREMSGKAKEAAAKEAAAVAEAAAAAEARLAALAEDGDLLLVFDSGGAPLRAHKARPVRRGGEV